MSFHFWRSPTLAFHLTTLLQPMTSTRGYLQLEPISYKKLPCHSLDLAYSNKEMSYFISFHFHFHFLGYDPNLNLNLANPTPDIQFGISFQN